MLSRAPYWTDLGVTRVTVVWALSLAVFSAAVVGVVPALKLTGKTLQQNIQRAAAGRSGIRFGGVSSALIITDVALAVATVGVAVALWDGVMAPSQGTNDLSEQFLSAEFDIPEVEPARDTGPFDQTKFMARVGETQRELVRRLAAEPGVRGIAVASVLPGMNHPSRMVVLDGETGSDDFEGARVSIARVAPGFFNALEQPILDGRGFELSDLVEERSAVIVNSTFVDRVLGGRYAIGRRVRYSTPADEEPNPWYEIVGVVGDLGMDDATALDRVPGLYQPLASGEIQPVRLAIHVGDDPKSFTPRLRELSSEVDPTAVISNPVALHEIRSGDAQLMPWIVLGAVILTGILLALSTSGIYALMSFTVTERTREIGIRTALGARRSSVVATVAKRSFVQLGFGILLGIPLATWLLSEFERDGRTSMHPPVVLALLLGVGVMFIVGALAFTAPTLRALRIMPTEALRDGG